MEQITNTRVTLADRAYQLIKDAIITLEFKPGQLIFETEIASLLGVSRTPVREALSRLRSEEMIEIFSQKGIQIIPISQKKVEEVRFVRESLEISTFREVAKQWNITSEKCISLQEKVRKTLLEQENAFQDGDFVLFFKSDEAYHYHIMEFINNKTLLDIISKMRAHINRVRFLELKESKHMIDILKQHENIFQAITTNDEEKVVKLLIDHYKKFQLDKELLQKYPQYFATI